QPVHHVPCGTDDTLPRSHDERIVVGVEGHHHPGRHADKLAVPAPPGGAEDLEVLAEVRPPHGAPRAVAAVELLEGRDEVTGADVPRLAARLDHRSGELRAE